MKKLIKIAVILAAIAVVLLAGTGITLKILFPPERIKSMAMPYIEEAVGREVKLEGVGITFLTGVGVKLKGLEIAGSGKAGFSHKPLFSLGAFTLKFSPMSVFGTGVKISSIILEEPVIRIEVDKDGNFNFDDLAFMEEGPEAAKEETEPDEEEGAMLPMPVSLKKFAIKNGIIIYNDRESSMEIVLGRVNQEISIDADKEMKDVASKGKMDIRDISVATADIPVKLKGLNFALAHDVNADLMGGSLKVNRLALELQKVAVAAKGAVTNLNTSPVLDLAVQSGKIDLADLLKEIPEPMAPGIEDLDGEGTCELDAKIKGDTGGKKPLDISGALKITGGKVQHSDLPQAVNDIEADIKYTMDDLVIKKFGLKLGSDPISLTGSIKDFEDPLVDLALNADVDLKGIKDLAELPKGTTLSGKVKANIKAKGKADPDRPQKLKVNGAIDLTNITYKDANLAKPAVLNGRLVASNARVTQTAKIKIGASNADLKATITNFLPLIMDDGKGKGPRTRAVVSVSSSLLDFDEILTATEGDDEAEEESRAPADAVEGDIMTDPLPSLDITAMLKVKKCVYEKIPLTGVMSDISLTGGVLNAATRARLYSGRIVSNVYMNARNHKKITIKNILNLESLEANDFVSNFNDLLKPKNALYKALRKTDNVLYGKLNLTSDISGSGGKADELTNSLTGDIFAKVYNGKIARTNILKEVSAVTNKFYPIEDITFKELDGEFKLEKGNVIVEKLTINSKDGDWDVNGKVGLTGSLDLTASDRLSPAISNKIAAVQNKGKGALKGLLKGTQLAGASGIIDGAGIPVDEEGRVTLNIGIKGTVDKPKPSLKGFGGKGSAAPSVKDQAKEALTKRATEEKDRLAAEAKKRLDAERAKREAQVKQKADAAKAKLAAEAAKQQEALKKKAAEEKKKLDATAAKKAEDIKKKAAGKLKGLFK